MFKILLTFAFLSGAFLSANSAVDLSGEPEVQTTQAQVNPQQQAGQKAVQPGKVSERLKLAENNPIAALICKMIRAFTGTIAKIIAILMVIGLAIALFAANTISPVTPVTIVSVIIGAGILFGADRTLGKIMGDAAMGGSASSACDCKYGVSCDTNI
jgi:type IV secretory pathway VirB2 component (pilin)